MKGQAQPEASGSQATDGQQLVAKGRAPRGLGNTAVGESSARNDKYPTCGKPSVPSKARSRGNWGPVEKQQGGVDPRAGRTDSDPGGTGGTARLLPPSASHMGRTWANGRLWTRSARILVTEQTPAAGANVRLRPSVAPRFAIDTGVFLQPMPTAQGVVQQPTGEETKSSGKKRSPLPPGVFPFCIPPGR